MRAPGRSPPRTTGSRASTRPSKAGTTTSADPRVPRFHLIGGKGGVGKTTCAAAIALREATSGQRVLVVSTDPAPSLGDALGRRLGAKPRPVPAGRGHLSALEIDAKASLRRWLDERRALFEEIAVQGTWLDREDIAPLVQLSLPGADELAALLEISRLSAAGRFDVVVVDTAPTGHTLRMLGMPGVFASVADVFERMRDKRRVMEEALRGSWRSGPEDSLVDELASLAQDLSALLRDASRTRISWVTAPEPLAVAETIDALDHLQTEGFAVSALIVNRVTPPPPSACRHCDGRRAFEARSLEALPSTPPRSFVLARRREPRGVRALAAIGRELSTRSAAPCRARRQPRWTARLPGTPVRASELAGQSTRLVMFGGKGGVGKTTCAAAVALDCAHRSRSRRVLLVSTDPAHSLGDVLGNAISDSPGTLPLGPPNLEVREIDPRAVLMRIRDEYLVAVDGMFDRISNGSFDAAHDRAVMRSLIQLVPPGLDELVAILEITEAVSSETSSWDLVVMDTAPTGHALRLLEMPTLLHDWSKALMAILLKYRSVVPLGGLADTLLNLSRGARRIRDLLSNAELARFVLVTRPAVLPRVETVRFAKRLSQLKIHAPAIVINAIGRGSCATCTAAHREERAEIGRLRREAAADRSLILAATQVPSPLGPSVLDVWGRTSWRVASGYDRTR